MGKIKWKSKQEIDKEKEKKQKGKELKKINEKLKQLTQDWLEEQVAKNNKEAKELLERKRELVKEEKR